MRNLIETGERAMIENNPTNVSGAFEMLLEEIEAEFDFINKVGARALEGRDYEGAREALGRASRATTLRDKLVSLRKEWETLTVSHRGDEEEEMTRAERSNVGHLQRGLRTPEKAYYQPILEALNELGGSARVNDVLVKVEQMMNGALTPIDYEPLPSNPEMLRWRNKAQWSRNSLTKETIFNPYSPPGMWEISEIGRMALTRGTR